jgi:predicted transposase/invertase (TIGR01784 family)
MKNLHDKFLKEKLYEKQNAIDFLRLSLPADVLQVLQLQTLSPTQSSFIPSHMRELFSDIVYQCRLTSNEEVYCTILVEHKSYNDPFVSFQIGEYIFAAYRQQIKNKEKFSVVIPLLFSHHEGEWKYRPL